MSSGSSSKDRKRILRAVIKPSAPDWLTIAGQEIWRHVVTLTICRIGHKPKLNQRTQAGRVSAEMTCTRCGKTLDFQISILLP